MAASAAAAGSSPGLCPGFAVICSFLERYGALLDLPELTFPQLERYLEETSTGELHFCVFVDCDVGGKTLLHLHLLENKFVRAFALGLIVCFRTSRLEPVLICCRRGGRIKNETSHSGSLKCVRASSVVSRRISGALCGGGFLLAAWLYLPAHCTFTPHTHITNKDGLLHDV